MPAQTIRPSLATLLRTITVTTALMALFLSFTSHAGAERKRHDVSSAGTVLALTCEAGGGMAAVDQETTTASGTYFVSVRCNGGEFDSLYCESFGNTGETNCSHLPPPSGHGK